MFLDCLTALSNRNWRSRRNGRWLVGSPMVPKWAISSHLGGIQYERQPPVSEALLFGTSRRFDLRHVRGPSRFVCRHRPPVRFEHCDNRGHWSRYPSSDVDGDVPAKTLPAGKLS